MLKPPGIGNNIGAILPSQSNANTASTNAVVSEWLVKVRVKCCLLSTSEVISISYQAQLSAARYAPVVQSNGIASKHGLPGISGVGAHGLTVRCKISVNVQPSPLSVT